MPRKTTILIVILALVTGILIFLAIRSDQKLNITNDITPTALPMTEPYALLSFSKEIIDTSTVTGEVSVDIILDTGGKKASGAQIELSYNPNIITNVKIATAQNSLFGPKGSVLFNSVDPTQGRISYAVGMPPEGDEAVGIGPIATITFNIAGPLSTTTQMTFLPKSAVTTLSTQESVLLSAQPLQIVASQNSLPVGQ